jgi:biotin carboxyl carrier protein
MRRLRVVDRADSSLVAELELEAGLPHAIGGHPSRALVLPLPTPPIDRSRAGSAAAFEVVVDGWRFEFDVEDVDRAELRARATSGRDAAAHDGPTEVRAIIPGRVVSVAVDPGDAVTAGGRLLAVEAMKMENEVRSPRDGIVERVAVGPGDTVELGDLLVVIR